MTDQNNPQPYYPASGSSQQGTPEPVSATNPLAIVSLISGIASYLFLPFIGAIVAVVTGHIALGQIKRTGKNGRGFALAGTILGYVHLALSVAAGIIVIIIIVGITVVGASSTNAYTPSSSSSYDQTQQQYDECIADVDPTDAEAIGACVDELAQR